MKTRLKFTIVTALTFILLSVFFLIPSFAAPSVYQIAFTPQTDTDDVWYIDGTGYGGNSSFRPLQYTQDHLYTVYFTNEDLGSYYSVTINGVVLSTDPENPTYFEPGSDQGYTMSYGDVLDSQTLYYFVIGVEPTPPPTPNLWDTIGDTTGGIFQVGISILNGILANDIIAFFVIAIPIFGVLVAIIFGIVGIAKNRKKKKNKKR